LKKNLASLEEENKDLNANDVCRKSMLEFFPTAKIELDKLEEEMKEMNKYFEELVQYFGEDEAADVTQFVYDFQVQFVAARKENAEAKLHAHRQQQKVFSSLYC
jgi:hypothetical protein